MASIKNSSSDSLGDGESERYTHHTINNGNSCITLEGDFELQSFQNVVTILNKWSFSWIESENPKLRQVLSLAACLAFKLPVLVISNFSRVREWLGVVQKHNIEIFKILTYDEVERTVVNRDLLTRSMGNNGVYNYNPTQAFSDTLDQGVFVIFDDIYESPWSYELNRICHSIVDAVMYSNFTKHRKIRDEESNAEEVKFSMCLMIYGRGPCSSYETMERMYMSGLIKSLRLAYVMPNGIVRLISAREIIVVCDCLDHNATNAVIQRWRSKLSTVDDVEDFCIDLYKEIIRHHLVGVHHPGGFEEMPEGDDASSEEEDEEGEGASEMSEEDEEEKLDNLTEEEENTEEWRINEKSSSNIHNFLLLP
jgi:hypothetical protein